MADMVYVPEAIVLAAAGILLAFVAGVIVEAVAVMVLKLAEFNLAYLS